MPEPLRFGVFELDPSARELRKHGVRIKLQDQPFAVLLVLLEKPGQLVTKEELQQRLWPADTFVEFDKGIYNAIKRLRETVAPFATKEIGRNPWCVRRRRARVSTHGTAQFLPLFVTFRFYLCDARSGGRSGRVQRTPAAHVQGLFRRYPAAAFKDSNERHGGWVSGGSPFLLFDGSREFTERDSGDRREER